ncbi:MAG: M48 family metalloprotease [Pseudomonadota bacterium]|nr:M48 family metalloprotease [Pseudomonadota bacterium]MDE3038239.1 M48 family metalloprotease [Pseudomonadota bacterium]
MATSFAPAKKQPRVGYRSSGDDMRDFVQSGRGMSATRMDKRSAPGWYAALEKLSAKAGVNAPALYRVPTHRINGGMAFDALVLTDGLITLAGSHPHDARPSREVMMVMAHELGHRKQGAAALLMPRLLPWAMPFAAMTALYLYDQANAKKNEQTPKELQGSIDRAADETVGDIKEAPAPSSFGDGHSHQVNAQWKESALHAGRYLLAGALGFGGGLLGTRHIMRHHEFDADHMAVLLTGDTEGYISFLKKLHTAGERQFAAEMAKKPRPVHVEEKLKDYIATQWKKLMQNTIDAHPSLDERGFALRTCKNFPDFRTRLADAAVGDGLLK